MNNLLELPKKTFVIFFMLLTLSLGFFASADSDSLHMQSLFQDADQDGLSDDEESVLGTDPKKKDSDGDGYNDGVEVKSGYDPLKPAPGDKLTTTDES